MTKHQKIQILLESIRSDWREIASCRLSNTEAAATRQHIKCCLDLLKDIYLM